MYCIAEGSMMRIVNCKDDIVKVELLSRLVISIWALMSVRGFIVAVNFDVELNVKDNPLRASAIWLIEG